MPNQTVEKKVGQRVIRVVKDDITDMEVEAFVFDITSDCKLGSGYGGAISMRGGKVVQEELDKVGHLPTCQAVVTTAGKMKAEHIIHVNGPKFHEPDTERKLRATVLAALQAAAQKKFKAVALPPIGTGMYQVPIDLCAKVLREVVVEHLSGETTINEVSLVALDAREYGPLSAALGGL